MASTFYRFLPVLRLSQLLSADAFIPLYGHVVLLFDLC